jgi:hypothetical protein
MIGDIILLLVEGNHIKRICIVDIVKTSGHTPKTVSLAKIALVTWFWVPDLKGCISIAALAGDKLEVRGGFSVTALFKEEFASLFGTDQGKCQLVLPSLEVSSTGPKLHTTLSVDVRWMLNYSNILTNGPASGSVIKTVKGGWSGFH